MDNLNLWMQKIERCVNACRELIHAYEVEIPEKGLLAGFHEPEQADYRYVSKNGSLMEVLIQTGVIEHAGQG